MKTEEPKQRKRGQNKEENGNSRAERLDGRDQNSAAGRKAWRKTQGIGWCNRKLINVISRERNGLEKS